MHQLPIQLHINPELYLKNPESSKLGKRIISNSISLINKMGFEKFTFKKLAIEIGSTESSIYRYFESKHLLLIYLINWYWSWVEYRLVLGTTNITDPTKCLKIAINTLTRKVTEDDSFSFINEVKLFAIIIAESNKAYHTKEVDNENEKGFFAPYKRVVARVSKMVLQCNPNFEFPQMLISTVIEGMHQQRYFIDHLPSLTNRNQEGKGVVQFYTQLVLKTISA